MIHGKYDLMLGFPLLSAHTILITTTIHFFFRLGEFELCEKLHRDITDLLNKRSAELRTSDTYARLSSSVRIRLKQFDAEVQQLSNKLRDATTTRQMYPLTHRLWGNVRFFYASLIFLNSGAQYIRWSGKKRKNDRGSANQKYTTSEAI